MPLHERKLSQSIAGGSRLLVGLSREIFSELDPLQLNSTQARSGRVSISTTTLHVVSEQAEALASLVLQHKNETAAPILRAMMEAYTRLVYVLLGDGETRLAALGFIDATHQLKDCNMVAMDYKKHDKHWPGEPQMYTDDFRQTLAKRREDLREIRVYYWEYLRKAEPKEYLEGGALSEETLLKKTSLSRMASRIDYEKRQLGENVHARINYSMIYGYLSRYTHASTLYLAGLRTFDLAGNIRINTSAEKDNEEDSLRTLSAAYALLANTFLEVLKELGRDTNDRQERYLKVAEDIFRGASL